MRIKQLLLIILFLGVSGLFVQSTYENWTADDGPAFEKKAAANLPDPVETDKIQRRNMPSAFFSVVAKKNPFSPDRSEFIKKASVQPKLQKKIARPNTRIQSMALFGVILAENEKKALIWEGKQAEWVKLGGEIASMKLDEVDIDKIILSDGANQYELKLDDQSNPQKKATAKVSVDSGPTIILTGKANVQVASRNDAANKPIVIGSSNTTPAKKN